jgi:hypothetical protein
LLFFTILHATLTESRQEFWHLSQRTMSSLSSTSITLMFKMENTELLASKFVAQTNISHFARALLNKADQLRRRK